MSVYETATTQYLTSDVSQLLNSNLDVEVSLEDRAARIGYILEFLISKNEINPNFIEIYKTVIMLLSEKLCKVVGNTEIFQINIEDESNALTVVRFQQKGKRGIININTTGSGEFGEEKIEYDLKLGITPTNISINEDETIFMYDV